MGRLNFTEILLLLVAALLLFGSKRLPEIARSFGKSIQEFKKGFTDKPDEKSEAPTNTTLPPSAPPPASHA